MKPELTEPFRERCYDCYRPRASCFCHAIPDIDNSTRVIIVQHQRERSHAFNTARIVKKSLRRCQLFSHRFEIEQLAEVAALPNTGLLFPGADAQPLPVAGHSQSLKQLVLIDGTWHHAKTMLRDIPVLRDLPCYQLAPESPGRYRIRREPNQFSLSTLEATVQALSVLEPETAGLGQLLNAFESMVEGQLAHPQERSLNLRLALVFVSHDPNAKLGFKLGLDLSSRVVVREADLKSRRWFGENVGEHESSKSQQPQQMGQR